MHTHSHSGHSHDHTHSNASQGFGRSFMVAAALNTIFIVAEVIYGIKANSLALLADAGHNFSDVIGLLLAWGAWWLSKRKPSGRYTYGLRSTSIIAANINAIFLLVAIGGISWEAIERLNSRQIVEGVTVMWVAGLGIFINGITAWMFSKGQEDLNIRAAFLHLASDAAISLGVVIAGLAIIQTGWLWLDPVVSLVISAVIVWSTWGLLRDSVNLALHAVPAHIDVEKVRAYLAGLPEVKTIHDLHIWGMSTSEVALSAHIVTHGKHPGDDFLNKVANELQHTFAIEHPTIQIEIGDSTHGCELAPDDKV